MQSKTINVGLFRTNCYIIEGSYSDESFVMVIDPGDHFSYIKENLPKKVSHIVITHYHPDHIGALRELKQSYPESIILTGEEEDTSTHAVIKVAKQAYGPWFERTQFAKPDFEAIQPDLRLKDNQNFLGFTVLHTPGHTKGSICLYHEKEKCIFTGDTLFKDTYGRTDFEGGDFDSMMFSIKKLMTLEDSVKVYPGHEGPTTIGSERIYY